MRPAEPNVLEVTGIDVFYGDFQALFGVTLSVASGRALALVGAPVQDGDQVFIAVLAIDGSGATVAYRKMWLGEEESRRFTPGPRPAAITVDGWRTCTTSTVMPAASSARTTVLARPPPPRNGLPMPTSPVAVKARLPIPRPLASSPLVAGSEM